MAYQRAEWIVESEIQRQRLHRFEEVMMIEFDGIGRDVLFHSVFACPIGVCQIQQNRWRWALIRTNSVVNFTFSADFFTVTCIIKQTPRILAHFMICCYSLLKKKLFWHFENKFKSIKRFTMNRVPEILPQTFKLVLWNCLALYTDWSISNCQHGQCQ